MNQQPVQKDETTLGDWLVLVMTFGLPLFTLAIEYAVHGIFAETLAPLISTDTISAIVPKLGKDLAFYAEKWPHLDPKSYIYWYFATLVICTTASLMLIPRSLRQIERPERRETMLRHWNKILNTWPWSWFSRRTSVRLALILQLLACFLVFSTTLFGPVQFGGRITVGLMHDAYMTLFLACYTVIIAGLPAMIGLLISRWREVRLTRQR